MHAKGKTKKPTGKLLSVAYKLKKERVGPEKNKRRLQRICFIFYFPVQNFSVTFHNLAGKTSPRAFTYHLKVAKDHPPPPALKKFEYIT